MKLFMMIMVIMLIAFLTSCGGKTMGNRTAVFETNQGTFKIELLEDKMPITTKNFIDLAEKGFYDGTKFHRVISGFMIQGGDPLSKDDSKKNYWGTGDPGYKIKDEFGDLGNIKCTIAMANAGPNTGGSQFFINLVDNNYLDNKHPVFGKVTEGMNIVEKIGKTKTGQRDIPTEDVVIEKILIR
ncbi:MAG: peptidylprolyl isomerase [Nanoarchaeota archaeon]|nr:peptidylprolyl isomerase [Nanoarchaeota archaeon]MBU1632060.1 peptidylprolyl isomerase [Nanoarchaeota archaeon]MBU1875813.1 peptidylprolyl isomerase [Nanoarchaeota archaeon]